MEFKIKIEQFQNWLSRKNPVLLAAVFFITFLMTFSIGFFLGSRGNNPTVELADEMKFRKKGAQFTSPLLECADNEQRGIVLGKTKKIQGAVDEAAQEKISQGEANHISIYFKDLTSGSSFGINEKEKFTPASLMKVPLMIAVYKMAESDPALLEKRHTYKEDDKGSLVENIKPEQSLESENEYTVEEMIRTMIVYSDNDAAKFLFNIIDEKILAAIYSDLGVEVPVRSTENYMSVKDYASFFRVLYNASYLDEKMSEKALELLSEIDFRDGLVAGVPEGIKISQKFGERQIGNVVQLHDCGIVYHPEKPFLLCVMTRGENLDELSAVIKDIAQVVYEDVSNDE